MIAQKKMINKVKEICISDESLKNALMYGSFAKGGGDEYSDIEFALFFEDELLKELDKKNWLSQICEIDVCYTNQFGIVTVIFSNLIRGEFHFYKASQVSIVSDWAKTDWFDSIEDALVIDKNNMLKPHLKKLVGTPPKELIVKDLQKLIYSFYNWYIFGFNLILRGEYARSLDILWWVQKNLLKLKRVEIGSYDNYGTPSKELEKDLTIEEYEKYELCTSNLNDENLYQAYKNCIAYFEEILNKICNKNDVKTHKNLLEKVKKLTRNS